MRLLFVTQPIDWPLAHGGQIRLWNTLQALRPCGQLDVVMFRDPHRPLPPAVAAGCRRVITPDARWLRYPDGLRTTYQSTLGRLALIFGRREPLRYLGPDNRKLVAWFERLVRRERYDVIWMSRATLAATLGWRDPRRTILDAADYEFVLGYHLLRTSPAYGAKVLDYLDLAKLAWWELQLARWFARVARCSEDDCRVFPARNAFVVPNGIPAEAAVPVGRAPEPRVLFVGSLNYDPNRAGCEWFLRDIWPRVRRAVPHAQLDVVGAHPPAWPPAHQSTDGVSVHGFVDDLGPYWRHAALSVAPLLAGAGTRLKILESIARGVPVVSTTLGAYGLALGEADGVVRTDEPAAFAGRCVERLLDPGKGCDLADHGRQTVLARYSGESIQRIIREAVRQVAERRGTNGRG